MRIVFDPSFDTTPWPGPLGRLGTRSAVAGEAWAGPHYLLDLLETALGLGGPPVPTALRAAALVPAVRSRDGFWSRSAEVDPLGTARKLLEWRDALWMAGWRGAPLAAGRIAALAAVTANALPGVPDRLAAVAAALARRSADIAAVEIVLPDDDFPAAWRAVFDGLAAEGTRITRTPLSPSAARGDLAAARNVNFTPASDGSVQLVCAHGPLQAADDVAAWLAARGSPADTVVIGADPVLDAALRRHGLPATGTARRPRDNALLQVLPLTLALGWAPPDPQRALELLTLPASAVRKRIAWALIKALHEQPAVDSDAWRAALADGLAAIEDPDDRARVAARLAVIFDARVGRGGRYPVAEVRRRLDMLDAWIRGRAATAAAEGTGTPLNAAAWAAAARSCAILRALVDQSCIAALEAPELERFVDEALDLDVPLEAFPAEAGLAAVAVPGALAGPAACVVWWNFDLESVPALHVLPMTREEREALAGVGVVVADPGTLAVAAAERWRRPLFQASEVLLLVSPRTGADGTERHLHPLWDEIGARAAADGSLASLVRETPAPDPPRAPRAPRPLPIARREWTLPAGAVRARAVESPSSLEALFGCSFHWAIKYQGGVWPGGTEALATGERLLGTLTHAIIARLLRGGVATPEAAAARAHAIFDADGARMAAQLFLPGADAARADARQVVGLAAHELFRMLAAARLSVKAVETRVERDGLGGLIGGIPDLVVGPPPAVIDLKWSGASYRRQQLVAGTASQLATYAYLVADPAAAASVPGVSAPVAPPSAALPSTALPPVAYFILRDQRLLTTDASLFAHADPLPGPDARATWDALERAYALRRAALDRGRLGAPGVALPDGTTSPTEDAVESGTLVLTPPCIFCEFDGLCGKAFPGAG